MKEEIKEILDFKENADYKKISVDEIVILKDYITNLQEEVNKLTAESTEWESKCYDLQEENKKLKEENKHIFSKVNDDELLISNAMNYAEAQDYKQRNEKAIEYITEDDLFYYGDELYDSYQEIINILKGDKDE